ncbi:MAG: hypothetical protein JXX14_04945 [Deltaproteobacteria bacterium]|nr:hypothetical protein [Deltaproteobacteria bacterium]
MNDYLIRLKFLVGACLFAAGCTQISGLSDYSKADNIIDGGTDDSGGGNPETDEVPKNCAVGCDDGMIGNGNCEDVCNNQFCGFDDGDCDNKYCVDGCLVGDIGDGVCNEPCNVEMCDFDGGDCGGDMACQPGCVPSMSGNGICNYQCLGHNCGNDGGDCDDVPECSPGCQNVLLGDGKCDEICNNESCFMDNGDCVNQTNPGCDGAGSTCQYDCVPCARVQQCQESVNICNNNPQCIFLQDCISVDCEDRVLPTAKDNCVDNCFQSFPNGVQDFEMMQFCVYCVACPKSCQTDFGEFCNSFQSIN